MPLISKLTETLEKLASKGDNIPLTGNNNLLTRLKRDGVPDQEIETSGILKIVDELENQAIEVFTEGRGSPTELLNTRRGEPEIISRQGERTGKRKQVITPEGLRAAERARKDTELFRSETLSIRGEEQKTEALKKREAELTLEKETERDVSQELIDLSQDSQKGKPIVVTEMQRRVILREQLFLRDKTWKRDRIAREFTDEESRRMETISNARLKLFDNLVERLNHPDSKIVERADMSRLEQGLPPKHVVRFSSDGTSDNVLSSIAILAAPDRIVGISPASQAKLDTLLNTSLAKNITLPDRFEERSIVQEQAKQEGYRKGIHIYGSYSPSSATGKNNFFTSIYEDARITALDPNIVSPHFQRISKHFDINYAYHVRGEEINPAKDLNMEPRERDPKLRQKEIKELTDERRQLKQGLINHNLARGYQTLPGRVDPTGAIGRNIEGQYEDDLTNLTQKLDRLDTKLTIANTPPIRIIFEIQADTQLKNYKLTAKDEKVIQDLEGKLDKLRTDAPNKDALEMEIADRHGKLVDWVSEKFLGSKLNDLTDIQRDKILTPFRRNDRILSNFSRARARIENWRNLSGLVKARYAIRMLNYQNTDIWQAEYRPRRRTFQQETPLFKSFFNEEELTEIKNQRTAISNLWDTISRPTRQSREYDKLYQEIEQTKYELKNPPIIHKINVAQNAVNQEIAKAIENNVEEIHFLINPGGERTVRTHKRNHKTGKMEPVYYAPGQSDIHGGDTRVIEEVGKLQRNQESVQRWYETTVVEVIEKTAKKLNARTEWSKKGDNISFIKKEGDSANSVWPEDTPVYRTRKADREFLKIILPVGVTVAPLTLYGQEHKEASFLATAQDIGIDTNVALKFLNEGKMKMNGRDNTKLINAIPDLINKYSTASKEDKDSAIKELTSLLEDVEPRKREKTTPIIRTPEEKFGSIYRRVFGEQ